MFAGLNQESEKTTRSNAAMQWRDGIQKESSF